MKISEEEAKQLIADDKTIEQNKKMPFDLDDEHLKVAKQYSNAGVRKTPTVYKFDQKEKKKNATKADVIAKIAALVEAEYGNADITNTERQIAFSLNGENFEITLVQKRKPKN